MPVISLPEDKPKIAFHAAMMVIQNMGVCLLYWGALGVTPSDPVCESTRRALLGFAITCFCVGFLCVGMGYGGYTDDAYVFAGYWFAHLVGGASYSLYTVIVPLAIYSDEGKRCAAINTMNGERTSVLYILHAVLYLVYVGSMLSITYFSYLKATFFDKDKFIMKGLLSGPTLPSYNG